MTEEPSNFALSLSERILSGESLTLTEAERAGLTAYERRVLQKTAERQGYKFIRDFDTGTITLAKDNY